MPDVLLRSAIRPALRPALRSPLTKGVGGGNLFVAPDFAKTGTGTFTQAGPIGGTFVSDGSANTSEYKAMRGVPGNTYRARYRARVTVASAIVRSGDSAINQSYISRNIGAGGGWIDYDDTVAMTKGDALYMSFGYGAAGATIEFENVRVEQTISRPGIYCWGDSLTASSGASGASAYFPAVLAALYDPDRVSINKGVGSETSSQVLTRLQAALTLNPALSGCTNVMWMGRNNFASPTQVKADIATAYAAWGGNSWVMSILTSSADTAGQITDIQTLNAELATLYGSRFIDVYAYLRARGNGTTDNAGIAAGYTPASLRSDSVHLNDAGYAHVADCVYAAIALGN